MTQTLSWRHAKCQARGHRRHRLTSHLSSAFFVSATVWSLSFAPHANAAILQAGSGKAYNSPCSAIAAARSGDVIEVDSGGRWIDDFCTISTPDLTLRSVGAGRAKVSASGTLELGPHQAIWAINAPGVTIEGFELYGARASKAIRVLPGFGVVIRNSFLHDNDVGVEVADGTSAEVLIERSEFSSNGNTIDIGHVARFTMRASYLHNGEGGALVLTRAAENYLLSNRITQEKGASPREIDVPGGGRTYLIGNLVQHGANSQDAVMVAYGRNGPQNPSNELYLVNNTLVNEQTEGSFVRLNSRVAPFAVIRNNIFCGNGTVDAAGASIANNFAGDPDFVDREGFDYRLRPTSPAINTGGDPGVGAGYPLTPVEQYLHPMGEEVRISNSVIDIGAYEYGGGTGKWDAAGQPVLALKPQQPAAAPRTPLAGDGGTLSLASGTVVAGSSLTLNLSLTSVGPQPSGLQWTLTYPAGDVLSVQVAAGAAATAASKSVSCGTAAGSTTCICSA
ncbi:MAG: right-handed parallel beta-helix repeat-containing protein [Bryobacteraceae bacterium]